MVDTQRTNGTGGKRFHRLGLAFENLFDAKYKYHASGVWAPGFNMLANVEIFY